MRLLFSCLSLLLLSYGACETSFAKPQKKIAEKKASANVKELFLDAPKELVPLNSAEDGSALSRDARQKRIKLLDLKNGYLEVETSGLDGNEGPLFVAMFTRKGASPLLALAYGMGDSTNRLKFLSDEGGGWKEITDTVFTKVTDKQLDQWVGAHPKDIKLIDGKLSDCASGTFRYVLPRYGRDIKVVAGGSTSDCIRSQKEVELATFHFDGAKFNLK